MKYIVKPINKLSRGYCFISKPWDGGCKEVCTMNCQNVCPVNCVKNLDEN